MMTDLLLLFLLCSMVGTDDPAPPPTPPPKTPVERCGVSMICFAPETCKGSQDFTLKEIGRTDLISPDCKIILKMRPLTQSKYRIVLESRDPTVTKITSKKESGDKVFSCEKGSVKFKDEPPKSIIAQKDDPLMCEFIAEEPNDAQMFAKVDKDVEFVADNADSSSTFTTNIEENIISKKPFCDPDNVKYAADSATGFSLKEVDLGLTDVSCALPYYLETKASSESTFVKTVSVICEKDGKDFKFTIKGEGAREIKEDKEFSARCAAKDCTLCEDPANLGTAQSISNATTGCKEITCASGRIRAGDNEAAKGVATCDKKNDKPVWSLNGMVFGKTDAVVCVDPVSCKSAHDLCPQGSCIVTKSELPACTGTAKLIYNEQPIMLECNDLTGRYNYTGDDGTKGVLPKDATLKCAEPGKGTEDAKSDPQSAGLLSTVAIPVIVAGIIILAALLVGGYFFMKKRQQEQQTTRSTAAKSKQEKGTTKETTPLLAGSNTPVVGAPTDKKQQDAAAQPATQETKPPTADKQQQQPAPQAQPTATAAPPQPTAVTPKEVTAQAPTATGTTPAGADRPPPTTTERPQSQISANTTKLFGSTKSFKEKGTTTEPTEVHRRRCLTDPKEIVLVRPEGARHSPSMQRFLDDAIRSAIVKKEARAKYEETYNKKDWVGPEPSEGAVTGNSTAAALPEGDTFATPLIPNAKSTHEEIAKKGK